MPSTGNIMDSQYELSRRIFFAHVDKTSTCWNWLGKLRKGYGTFTLNGKTEGAHRISWRLNVGEIPDGMCVLHKCDNPACVRPDHLYVGTQLQNVQDRVKRRRTNVSTAHISRRKLTEEQVREIWDKRNSGIKYKDLRLQYGVSDGCIADIMSRKTWSFLALPTEKGVGGIAEGREVDTRAGSYTRDRVSPSSVGLETAQVSGCMTSEYQASPADSIIFDRHGDDRFADNILRALEGLPQNGDDEEERDAREEGALIEASGYPDPKFDSNGRY